MTKIILLLMVCALAGPGNAGPYFVDGQDPRPKGRVWSPVEEMSDDFAGKRLDRTKWQDEPVGDGWMWIGRPPGLFKAGNVTLKDGRMCVTVSRLDQPVLRSGNTFTHQGAIVRSRHPGQVGWYFECRMKANATVMSSTFWLMTKSEGSKKLELDIQECVGRVSDRADDWVRNWDRIYHSNAIHRKNAYNPESRRVQNSVPTEVKNHERFFVYGAWWKSDEEVLFYLDGKHVYTLRPPIKWDVPAYIQMAVETYDWNPLPTGECLVDTGTWEQRTTQYDWVRVWKLRPAPE